MFVTADFALLLAGNSVYNLEEHQKTRGWVLIILSLQALMSAMGIFCI
uniref:Uncharacterized protein n=1 Tax=mine drainage metagenome TaxID=410659 RepID=E6QHT1_9ZZZZ